MLQRLRMYSSSCLKFASVNVVDHIDKAAVFLVALDTWVVNVGCGAKIVSLSLAILVSNNTALLSRKRQKLAFFFSRETLEVSNTVLHLGLEEGKEGIVLIFHEATSDASEG